MQYVAAKKAKLSQKEEELEKAIHSLHYLMDSNQTGEVKNEAPLKNWKIIGYNRRKQFHILKTKGAILRATCRWYNKGEKKVQSIS